MKKSSKLRLFALAMTLAVALAGCGSNVASADEDDQQAGNEAESTQGIDWPQKAVTVVVPASAGGDTDSYFRPVFGAGARGVCGDFQCRRCRRYRWNQTGKRC